MPNFHINVTFSIDQVLSIAAARKLEVGAYFNTRKNTSGVVGDIHNSPENGVSIINCYDGWMVGDLELGSFLMTPTLFLDSRVPNDTFFPVIPYKELDCARVAEGVEHGDGAGYICNCCQQEVRFYNAGPDSTRWACDCE